MPAASVSTPNACAIWATLLGAVWLPTPATTCHRSEKAGLIDSAIATWGVNGPFSPELSLVTSPDHPDESAGKATDGYTLGSESGGMYWLLKPSSILVCTFIPCLTAVARMYGLNEEPTCSRFCVAMFHWQSIRVRLHSRAVRTGPVPLAFEPGKPGPGYRPWIWPVAGSSSSAPACM